MIQGIGVLQMSYPRIRICRREIFVKNHKAFIPIKHDIALMDLPAAGGREGKE